MAKTRCPRCSLHLEFCLCAEIPSLALSTRVVILMHYQEVKKPSNTGRLAHHVLPNSEIRYRGEIGKPLSLDGLEDPDRETWLLHLSEESEPLDYELVASLTKPVRLIVPDGTWSQASRLGSKLARTMKARHVYLKSDAPSEYKLRAEHHPDGMATYEAIARALGIIEGRHVREEMEILFRKMVERELVTRGRLPRSGIRGGLPGE